MSDRRHPGEGDTGRSETLRRSRARLGTPFCGDGGLPYTEMEFFIQDAIDAEFFFDAAGSSSR